MSPSHTIPYHAIPPQTPPVTAGMAGIIASKVRKARQRELKEAIDLEGDKEKLNIEVRLMNWAMFQTHKIILLKLP